MILNSNVGSQSIRTNGTRIYHDSPIHRDGDCGKLARKERKMKLAVVGSRAFNDFALLTRELDSIHAQTPIELIVSGGAKGADSLAEEWARLNGVKTQIFLPDWKKHRRGAAFVRNRQIIAECERCLAFWDGTSKGTQNSIELAKGLGKKARVILV